MVARVLIADSDANAAEEYRDHLFEFGYGVAVASGGLECIRSLREMSPDVLVLSAPLLWGGCDGVMTLMRQEPELRPPFVILLTSGRDRKAILRALATEIDDYQHKPLSPRQLQERIQRVLDQYPTDAYLAKKE
jgi:DNA-binding response OmpR family regulator